jgi:AraC family transcriptional regulator
MEWIRAMQRAIDYIEERLTEEIDYAKVAEQAYSSSFHFQRIFHILANMTLGEYIRNRRLSKAGEELAATNAKVIDVALKYGYDSPESFAKAFTRFHGIAPSEARKEGVILKSFNRLSISITLKGGSIMEYQIIKKDSFYVLVKARSFHMDNHLGLIPEFWDECNQDDTFRILCKNGIKPEILGICEPEKKGQKTFRYGIGIECAEDTVAPEGYEVWKLAAHTWAVFRCVGPMPKAIQELNHRIYTEFFPQSEYEPISDIDFERYPGENSKADYSAEVWIPVRKKTN